MDRYIYTTKDTVSQWMLGLSSRWSSEVTLFAASRIFFHSTHYQFGNGTSLKGPLITLDSQNNDWFNCKHSWICFWVEPTSNTIGPVSRVALYFSHKKFCCEFAFEWLFRYSLITWSITWYKCYERTSAHTFVAPVDIWKYDSYAIISPRPIFKWSVSSWFL